MKLVDGKERTAVQAHKSAAGTDELVDRSNPFGADTSGVSLRHGADRGAIDDAPPADVGKHDDVVSLAQIAGHDVGVAQARRSEAVLLQ